MVLINLYKKKRIQRNDNLFKTLPQQRTLLPFGHGWHCQNRNEKLQLLSKQGAGRVVGTNWKEAMEELDLGMAQRFLGKRF